MFFVSGQAASGKSKFAEILAIRRTLTILDLDDNLEKTIVSGKIILKKMGMEKFLSFTAPQRYEKLLDDATALFMEGQSLVIVAPFTKQIANENVWQKITQVFESAGVSPVLIWVNIPHALRASRLESRGFTRDQGKLLDLDSYLLESNPTAPAVDHILIDGSKDFSTQIENNF